jgi:hypothetical protein
LGNLTEEIFIATYIKCGLTRKEVKTDVDGLSLMGNLMSELSDGEVFGSHKGYPEINFL